MNGLTLQLYISSDCTYLLRTTSHSRRCQVEANGRRENVTLARCIETAPSNVMGKISPWNIVNLCLSAVNLKIVIFLTKIM